MQSQDQAINTKAKLLQELLEFGFEEQHILKAIELTQDKELAAQIVLKLIEEGPDADLTIYQAIKPQIKQNKIEQQKKQTKAQSLWNNEGKQLEKVHEYNKPIRPKMLFIVNGQLKMGKGKVCAQVAHAVIGAYLQIEEEAKFDERSSARLRAWESSGTPKIVVKAQTEREMLQIKKKLQGLKIGINTYLVEDAGHTQIKAGSKTVLGIGPVFSSQIDAFTEHLKLM